MSLDALARFFAQVGRQVPLLSDFSVEVPPFPALERVDLIKPFDCGEMQKQRSDRVRLRVVEMIELRHA
jgi:hypothetical protein